MDNMTEYKYHRNKQLQADADVVMKRVLIIYTGGTIGMVESPNGTFCTVRRAASSRVLQGQSSVGRRGG